MPKNKDALIRYRIIDNMLRNRHRIFPKMDDFIEVMAEKTGKSVSASTIQKDINAMKYDSALGFLAPIEYNRRYNGYFYTDENYTIASIPLNDEDIEAIDFAALVLEQFQSAPIFSQYNHAVGKILEAVNISRQLNGFKEDTFIHFEQMAYQEGSHLLGRIISAIKQRKKIVFSYKRFDADEAKEHTVNPYILKEYRNRWYLIGMNDKLEYITTYGLDRISNLLQLDEDRRLNVDFDADEYFQYAFGIITYNAEPREIVLSFTPLQGKYIKSQPLHASQQVLIDNKDEFRISLNVWPTIELKMQILSYGPNVKVIAPSDFAGELKNTLKETLDLYQS